SKRDWSSDVCSSDLFPQTADRAPASLRSDQPDRHGRGTGVSDHLNVFEDPGSLRRPIVIMAFSGWNDAAESATTAARYLARLWPSRGFASIDPEEFYH